MRRGSTSTPARSCSPPTTTASACTNPSSIPCAAREDTGSPGDSPWNSASPASRPTTGSTKASSSPTATSTASIFWSKFPPTRDRTGSGRIRHTGFTRLEGGEKGILGTTADWIAPTGQVLLKQNSQMTIRAGPAWRTLDLQVSLTAQDEPVTFGDIEEGLLAIRVASGLREDRTGRYLNAEGLERAENVWGKRSPWVALHRNRPGRGPHPGHPQPPPQRPIPHILARPRLRPLRRQPLRPGPISKRALHL